MTNDSIKTFTICEVDKIEEVKCSLLSLAELLRSSDDGKGSYVNAGRVLEPIARTLSDVCDARSKRVLSHFTDVESESA